MFKMLCFNGIQTINNSYTQSCSMSEFLKIRRKEIGLNLHEKKKVSSKLCHQVQCTNTSNSSKIW